MKKVMSVIIGLIIGFSSFSQNVSNSKNPYDFVGKKHNDALEFVSKKIGFEKKVDFQPVIVEYLKANFSKTDVDLYIKSQNVKEQVILTDFENEIFLKLSQAVNGNSIFDVTKKIIKIEDQILINKPKLPNPIFMRLMCTCSVARYSNLYWTKYSEKPNNNASEKKIKLPKWVRIILADVRAGLVSKGTTTCEVLGDAATGSCEAAQ